jgi:hypothetical protein
MHVVSIPLSPKVLAIVAAEPRDVGGVDRKLARRGLDDEQPAHQAATSPPAARGAPGLIDEGGARVLRITARGRRELSLQRALAGLG